MGASPGLSSGSVCAKKEDPTKREKRILQANVSSLDSPGDPWDEVSTHVLEVGNMLQGDNSPPVLCNGLLLE